MKWFNLKKVLVIILVIIAIVLALLLYNKNQNNSSNDSKITNGQKSPVSDFIIPAPGKERDYLFSLNSNSPQEDREKHFRYAVSISEESKYLNVAECKVDPLVLKVIEGQMINFKNDSDLNVEININSEHKYTIKAKSVYSIKANLGNGIGLYGYGCNMGHGGMIFVEHK